MIALRQILEYHDREDLSNLLAECTALIEQDYDSYNQPYYQCTIIAPLKSFYVFKSLDEIDRKLLLSFLEDLYPPQSNQHHGLTSLDFRLLRPEDETIRLNEGTWSPRSKTTLIRAFISYSTDDDRIASIVKHELEKFGIEAFLAHEDVKPTYEWQKAILSRLIDSDIFVPILTDNFYNSPWTDQETGVAIGRGKIIAPIMIGVESPQGFLGAWQGRIVKQGNYSQAIKALIRVLLEEPLFEPSLRERIIFQFENNEFLDELDSLASLFTFFNAITDDQMRRILSNISGPRSPLATRSTKDMIQDLINKFPDKVNYYLAHEVNNSSKYKLDLSNVPEPPIHF